tara:strand:- start:540 stop:1556 length:1017 start_codon:yes stop_codon:yes gene_type:complete
MKKTLLLFAAIFTFALAGAQTFDVDVLSYNITSDTTVEVTGQVAGSSLTDYTITVPSTVENAGTTYTITAVAAVAFMLNDDVDIINLPNTIITIGNAAFREATYLHTVNMQEGITTIGTKVFRGSTKLATVVIPNSVTSWGTENFSYCSGLTDLTLGTGITSVNNRIFYQCSLSTLVLSGSIVALDEFSFKQAKVTAMLINSSVPPVIHAGWEGIPAAMTVSVPVGSLAAYQAADIWSEMTLMEDASLEDQSTLSTANIELDLNFSVYPNPTANIVTIKSKQLENADVTVHDLTGKTLLSKSISGTSSEINISSLTSGIYLFKVKVGNSEFVKRIVKQ